MLNPYNHPLLLDLLPRGLGHRNYLVVNIPFFIDCEENASDYECPYATWKGTRPNLGAEEVTGKYPAEYDSKNRKDPTQKEKACEDCQHRSIACSNCEIVPPGMDVDVYPLR